jgi:hypothetical protein
MHCHSYEKLHSRREFLSRFGLGLGALGLSTLLSPVLGGGAQVQSRNDIFHGGPRRAKRVIYLFQSGAPSQQDLFDHKPLLRKMHGEELPASVRNGQRLTGMSSGQATLPLAGSVFDFKRYGECGMALSDRLPYLSKVVDDVTWIRSMHTDAINHDPALMFIQTGSQFPGRPSMGSWVSYGLGSENENLPSFVVLTSKGSNGGAQPIYPRAWGAGFLASQHQGVQFRSGADPVLYLSNPGGISREARRNQLDHLRQLQEIQLAKSKDPETDARIAQYEMAYRMQTSVPELMDTAGEPDYIYDMYGEDSRKPGTYAANCLLARRLAEQDVRFIQVYHRGWDAHGNCPRIVTNQARDTDQPTAALITDLKQRGLLEDTLVIWGGEFGRTAYSQGKLTADNYGRDHHPKCYTLFMAGGGTKSGLVYGATDDFSYNITENPVHIHDLQATIMHLLGIDHEAFTYKHQGRRYRLTDVHGHVNHDLIA